MGEFRVKKTMSIRYNKTFNIPRQIAKHLLSLCYPFIKVVFKFPKVSSVDETLDKIIKDKCSVSRYGDGEFLYIVDKLNLPFQKYDPKLGGKLISILKSNINNIIICLPVGYHSMYNLNKSSLLTWRSQISWIYPRVKKYIDMDKVYYNTNMTRVYIDYVNKSDSIRYFEKLKKIWGGREVLLIEGEKSRLGVGNDLFANVSKIERILAPMHNAFSKYSELIGEAKMHDKSKLILIALGPTATALSFDLTMLGFQAIDIGNVDIEYEWFLRGAINKVRIPYKYTSEALGGRIVDDMDDPIYKSQIIRKIL
jgi:glycosyltransferase family protein